MLHVVTPSGFIDFHQPAIDEDARWLIGIASVGQEYSTCRRIEEERPIGIYLPFKVLQRRAGRNRVVDVVRALMPSYFFVPACITDADYSHVRNTPGVFDFLQVNGKPAVIRDRELARARRQEREAEEKRQRRLLETGKAKHFIPGEPVSVNVGFVVLEAVVHAVGAKRVEVDLGTEVTLFGRRVVEVDLAHIKRRENFSEE